MTDNNGRLRLVGYVRVSTANQVDNGQGLAIQEEAIKKWTKDAGHRLLDVYRDEGASGASDERDGLEGAIAAVVLNGANGLVAYSLDRLARSLTVQEAVLQQIWKADGKVYTVDTGEVMADDPDDPVRTFVRQVLGAGSQMEAGLIRRRLTKGKEAKAARGGYAYGRPAYGFKAEGKELVEDAEEQAVIRLAGRLQAEGSSLRQIMACLNAWEIPAKTGGVWHPTTVMYLLKPRPKDRRAATRTRDG